METVILVIVAVLMPTAAGYGWVAIRRLVAACEARRPAAPPVLTFERIHSDLRRLHALLDEAENAPSYVPAKNHRCRATRAAYLDALSAACRQYEVPLPHGRPVPRAEIYRVEAELRHLGLDVRSAA